MNAPAPVSSAGGQDGDYADYARWKDWGAEGFMAPGALKRATYDAELAGVDLTARPVLELGFGNGGFLGWARLRGAELWGSELQAELCARAAEAGVHLAGDDLAGLLPVQEGRFALIAAWDVLEHVPAEALPGLLTTIAALLADDGLFVARFPNGQSPLGAFHQHADITHRTVLSAPIMRQLIADLPFAPLRIGNPAPLPGLARRLRRAGQRLVELAVQRLYGTDAPLSPNSVALLRRTPRGRAGA